MESELPMQQVIPWQTFYNIGEGFDALTGEPKKKAIMGDCKLVPVSPNQRRKETMCKARQNIEEIFHGTSNELAVSVNFPSNLGVGAGIKNLWAKNLSYTDSSILVEYKVEGCFHAQLLDPEPEIKPAARKVSDEVFRHEYGDYYIAGYTMFFSFRAFALCEYVTNLFECTMH
jgi:hypothetical protein